MTSTSRQLAEFCGRHVRLSGGFAPGVNAVTFPAVPCMPPGVMGFVFGVNAVTFPAVPCMPPGAMGLAPGVNAVTFPAMPPGAVGCVPSLLLTGLPAADLTGDFIKALGATAAARARLLPAACAAAVILLAALAMVDCGLTGPIGRPASAPGAGLGCEPGLRGRPGLGTDALILDMADPQFL